MKFNILVLKLLTTVVSKLCDLEKQVTGSNYVHSKEKKLITEAYVQIEEMEECKLKPTFVPQAVLGITNTFSLGITIDDNFDFVNYMYSNETVPKESEIEYEITHEGVKTFFRTDSGVCYNLEDFMRI